MRTWLPNVFQRNRDGVLCLLLSVRGGSFFQFGSPAEKHVRLPSRLFPSCHDRLFERVTYSFDKGTGSGLAAHLNVPTGFHRSGSVSDYFRRASVNLLWRQPQIIVSVAFLCRTAEFESDVSWFGRLVQLESGLHCSDNLKSIHALPVLLFNLIWPGFYTLQKKQKLFELNRFLVCVCVQSMRWESGANLVTSCVLE